MLSYYPWVCRVKFLLILYVEFVSPFRIFTHILFRLYHVNHLIPTTHTCKSNIVTRKLKQYIILTNIIIIYFYNSTGKC